VRSFLLAFFALFSLASCATETSTITNEQSSVSRSEESKSKLNEDVVEVTIKKFKFIPEVITIKKGQTIRWVNKEKRQYHSVWFKEYGEAESDYIFPDEAFEKSFDKDGTFNYICGPHPEMIGKVIVK